MTAEKAGDGYRIGFRVIPPARGRGICTEAICLLCDRLFGQGAEKITAEANPGNHASIRVLEKAGFTHTGYREKAVEVNGRWLDGSVFSLAAPRSGPGCC